MVRCDKCASRPGVRGHGGGLGRFFLWGKALHGAGVGVKVFDLALAKKWRQLLSCVAVPAEDEGSRGARMRDWKRKTSFHITSMSWKDGSDGEFCEVVGVLMRTSMSW